MIGLDHLLRRVEELAAREEIRSVLYACARGMDRGDAQAVKGCYHPDASDVHWETFVGSAHEFADYMAAEVRTITSLIHEVGNPLIDLRGDQAFVESRCTSRLRIDFEGAPDGCWVEQVAHCRYLDVFEQRAGAWKIAHRRIVKEGGRTTLITGQPVRQPIPEAMSRLWPDDLVYRGADISELAPAPVAPAPDHYARLRAFGQQEWARRGRPSEHT
jgi:ketosteroid isomerase-like protein